MASIWGGTEPGWARSRTEATRKHQENQRCRIINEVAHAHVIRAIDKRTRTTSVFAGPGEQGFAGDALTDKHNSLSLNILELSDLDVLSATCPEHDASEVSFQLGLTCLDTSGGLPETHTTNKGSGTWDVGGGKWEVKGER